jgi:hypothetical protein
MALGLYLLHCPSYPFLFPNNYMKISAHADGGPRSRVCACETLRSAPHRREQKFSGTHVCRVTFKQIPQPLKTHVRSFGTLRQHLKILPLSAQI